MKRSLSALLVLIALAVSWEVAPADPAPPGDPRIVDERWVVKRVSADGQTLILHAGRGGCDPEPRATVVETEESVEIRVWHVTPAVTEPCPAIAVIDKVGVRLAAAIGGRALIGQSLGDAPPLGLPGRERVPRMLGLRAADARFALRAFGFRVRGDRAGTVIAQRPRSGSQTDTVERPEVQLMTDARRAVSPIHAEKRPKVLSANLPRPGTLIDGAERSSLRLMTDTGASVPPLEPVPFRTVAKGDGGSSRLRERAGLVVRGERRWTRVWRKLSAGTRPRPRRPAIDFSRHMLLVAVQGKQPSGGHRARITDVGDTGGSLQVTVSDQSPGRDCIVTGEVTSPFHVVRIRRGDERVHFIRYRDTRDCAR